VSGTHTEILVIGAGPGGYTAAFRAADLGKKVVLVDRRATLGGVCLNVGCIPSKALLHAAKTIKDAAAMASHGVSFGVPAIDLEKLRGWKAGVVGRLTGGLVDLARRRNVMVVQGAARFDSANSVIVKDAAGAEQKISFEQAIIAAGSEPVSLPFMPKDDPRVIDSTGALALQNIPARLHKRLAGQFEKILLKTKITAVEAREDGLLAHFEGPDGPSAALFDQVLVAVGRKPNGRMLGAEAAGVTIAANGTIPVDQQMRTNMPHIFAVGDVVGQPMLAHKATHEAKVAAEAASGHKAAFEARVIPSVAYTDPEIAWVGLTETEAKRDGIAYEKGVFPWAASGRSLALGRDEGFTKLLFDKTTKRLIGAGIAGPSAGDLIAEAALAIEMGADEADIGMTIHPHPTLSETIGLAAESYAGTITDLMPPRRAA
jgi:dihydrolipoamide dehydrogenase